MTDRQDAQVGIDSLAAKQGTPDSITPTNLAGDHLQPILDNAAMLDEISQDPAVVANTAKISYTDAALVAQHTTDIATNATGISDNATDIATNASAIADNVTDIATNTQEVADIRTTTGTAAGATNMGTYTGSTISDNGTVKQNIQELETALEAVPIPSGPLMTTAWTNPFDDYTILATDNRIDGFPDLGTPANATYTLLPAASYPVGWSCDIYNDTAEDWKIFINDDTATQLYEIFEGSGANVRVNDTQDGFIFVALKGEAPVQLGVEYADFNNFTIWQDRTFKRAVINDATAADINGFAPFFVPDAGAGIFYDFDITMRNDVNGFKIDVSVTSNQDSTNNGIGRIYERFGPDMPTSTGNAWTVPALLSDATTPLLTSQQLYTDQFPVDTATPMLIKFSTGAVSTAGGFEILADGGTFNFELGRFTLDSTASFGRSVGTGEAELSLYGAINLTTDPSTAVDSDYVTFGRNLPQVLDDQKILITPQYSAKYFEITSLPTSIRYYLRRMPTGANDGGLFFRDYSAYTHFGNPYVGGGGASAGLSVFEHGA